MKILLHVCCGPCSLYPIDELMRLYPEAALEAAFYNPNIHPMDEFIRRKEGAVLAAASKNISLTVFDDFDQAAWDAFEPGKNPARCTMCYSTRLGFMAEYAAGKGYTHLSTSLLVSPYQDHENIVLLGELFSKKYGIDFLNIDFRPGFRNGQSQARELGIYRQKYCGCLSGKE